MSNGEQVNRGQVLNRWQANRGQANGEVLPIEELRRRIRRAIVEREAWEYQNRVYRQHRAELVSRVLDGVVVGLVYVLGIGWLIDGYLSTESQVARNLMLVVALGCWVVARVLPRIPR